MRIPADDTPQASQDITTTETQMISADRDAAEIGDLHRQVSSSLIDAVRYAIRCGKKLIAKKAALKKEFGHGSWLPWLEANKAVLGFESDSTARRYMAIAKSSVDARFDNIEALKISRLMWANTLQPKSLAASKPEHSTAASRAEPEYQKSAREKRAARKAAIIEQAATKAPSAPDEPDPFDSPPILKRKPGEVQEDAPPLLMDVESDALITSLQRAVKAANTLIHFAPIDEQHRKAIAEQIVLTMAALRKLRVFCQN
jgi:hypothetical protein